MTNNPLKNYFRQPAIYLSLISGGDFYPTGTLDLPPTGELAVLPMTAKDEITYRTPDALLSGQAVVSVIQSCIPGISNAWEMSSVDLDAILIAIRIATYGHEMNFDSRCPHCNTVSSRAVDLRYLLGLLKNPDFHQTLTTGDLHVHFKPMNYRELNENNRLQWQHRKNMQVVQDSELPDEEKLKLMGESLIKLTEITVEAMTSSISMIRTPDAMVSEPDYIREFLNNCDKDTFTRIQEHIIHIREQAATPPLPLTCESCQGEYNQEITLDMTSFFAAAS